MSADVQDATSFVQSLHALHHLLLQDVEIPTESLLGQRLARREVMFHLAEDPGAADAASANHYAVYAIVVEALFALLGGHHVAVANDGDRHAWVALHLANQAPVGLACVHLRTGATMDGEGCDAAVLQLLGQLHDDAMENAPKIKPAEIKGMSEVMAEMMGIEQAEMFGMGPVAPEDEKMFVASVPDKIHGAGVLAYQDFMDQAAERVGGDFYILPSSLHEVLLVPDNGQMQLSDLEAMVKEVNATQVDPVDKLTDSVYHYDSKEKIFELGKKFVERQNQREEMAEKETSEEKGDKSSVLGELKAKKEEVAKTPKKESIDKGAKAKGGEAL